MIKLKNLLSLLTIAWKAKQKKYIVLASTTNLDVAKIYEFTDFPKANAKALELVISGDVQLARVVLELTYLEVKKEIKK